MANRLQIGCRVQAHVGPMGPSMNQDGTPCKRTLHLLDEGTIIRSVGLHKFDVQFDTEGEKCMNSSQLRWISAPPTAFETVTMASPSMEPPTAIPMVPPTALPLDVETVMTIPSPSMPSPSMPLPSMPSPSFAPPTPTALPLDVKHVDCLIAGNNHPIPHVDEEVSDDNNDDEDEFEESDKHKAKLLTSKRELQQLIDERWSIQVGTITWHVVESSVVEPLKEYSKGVGVNDFPFENFIDSTNWMKDDAGGKKRKQAAPKDASSSFPYLELFQKLWPGDWQSQLCLLNKSIADYSDKNRSDRHHRKVEPVTGTEFWRFIGIIIAAALVGYGGERLWDDEKSLGAKWSHGLVSTPPNFKRYMHKRRFEDIKRFFINSFSDASRSDKTAANYDPWWPVISLLEAFNTNRHFTVSASFKKVLDEIMSGYSPQTTKLGGYPNISYILRKPVDLGTELKVTCCAVTGIMLHVELQRGKKGMPLKHPDNKTYGATTACTLRQVEATQGAGQTRPSDDNTRNLYYGDSWFASVKTAKQVYLKGHSFVGPVKTAHKNFPKEAIKKKMLNWSGGMSMVLKGTTESGVHLLAIGYKYNSRKALTFVATQEAGSTTPGKPYMARFPDAFCNVVEREVPRPDIILQYFEVCNKVDNHNKTRQGDLALEKHWITHNCWFRILTTFIGIVVTDAAKAFHHGVGTKCEKNNMSIHEFADLLVWEMWNFDFKKFDASGSDPIHLSPPSTKAAHAVSMEEMTSLPPFVNLDKSGQTPVMLTTSTPHTKRWNDVLCGDSRKKRTHCCSATCNRLTALRCVECKKSYCDDGCGINKDTMCWSDHIKMN